MRNGTNLASARIIGHTGGRSRSTKNLPLTFNLVQKNGTHAFAEKRRQCAAMTGNKEGETFANKKEKRPAANAADSPFYRHTGTRSRLGVVVMSMRGSGSASATGPRKYGCCRHAWYPALAKILCRGLQGYVKQPVHFSSAGAKYFSVLWRTPQFQFFSKISTCSRISRPHCSNNSSYATSL